MHPVTSPTLHAGCYRAGGAEAPRYEARPPQCDGRHTRSHSSWQRCTSHTGAMDALTPSPPPLRGPTHRALVACTTANKKPESSCSVGALQLQDSRRARPRRHRDHREKLIEETTGLGDYPPAERATRRRSTARGTHRAEAAASERADLLLGSARTATPRSRRAKATVAYRCRLEMAPIAPDVTVPRRTTSSHHPCSPTATRPSSPTSKNTTAGRCPKAKRRQCRSRPGHRSRRGNHGGWARAPASQRPVSKTIPTTSAGGSPV